MSPYEIDILLWYHTRPGDHPDIERKPPVWRPTIESFKRESLLTEGLISESRYTITDRGRAYCEALQRVPLPEAVWVINWPNGEGPRAAQ